MRIAHSSSRLMVLILIVYALCAAAPWVSLAQRANLPSPLCALIAFQVVCYDTAATPHGITPSDQRVTDFTIAPDGQWVAYRAGEVLQTISVHSTIGGQVDTKAAPPAMLDLTKDTIAWSPDGLALAYTTANGLRIAFLTSGAHPQLVNAADHLYVNLRFSPTGTKIAAQADDNTWNLFTIQSNDSGEYSLRRTRTIDRPADVAWVDDNAVIVAPETGGLMRLDANDPQAAPAWTVADGIFIRLIAMVEGKVLALNPAAGETFGLTVMIGTDGKIVPLGKTPIDARVEWGQSGQLMTYITSGTPILVDRITGDEDTLPIRSVKRLIWSPAPPPPAVSVSLDADLYFLAPDGKGVRQVWRLSGTGNDAVSPVTDQPRDIRDFAVSPDKTHLVLVTDQKFVLVPILNDLVGPSVISANDPPTATTSATVTGTLTRTPRPRTPTSTPHLPLVLTHTPTPEPPHILAALSGLTAGIDWDSTGKQIAYADASTGSLYLVSPDGRGSLLAQSPDRTVKGYTHPIFSLDGQYLLAEWHGAAGEYHVSVFNLRNNTSSDLNLSGGDLSWGPGDLILDRDNCNKTTRLAVVHIPSPDSQPIIKTSWQVAAARLISNESILFLRDASWRLDNTACGDPLGPNALRVYSGVLKSGQWMTAEAQSMAYLLSNPLLSPSGKFAAGLWQADTINRLVILNLQNGREITIAGISDVSSLRWVS